MLIYLSFYKFSEIAFWGEFNFLKAKLHSRGNLAKLEGKSWIYLRPKQLKHWTKYIKQCFQDSGYIIDRQSPKLAASGSEKLAETDFLSLQKKAVNLGKRE